jgi:hypothetical protein
MPCKRKAEKRGLYDPKKKALKVRKRLTDKPKVLSHKDFKADGLIRVLARKDGTYFPEFALYPQKNFNRRNKARPLASLVDAGLTEESRGKWVLRTNKFNIFVYV